MARWKPAPVIGGAYSDDAKAWTCQDTVNYIPVMAERPGGRSPTMLRGAPGMAMFCDTGSSKPIRGARNVEGLLLVVTGTTLYKVNTKGVATAIGTIPGVGRVSMSHNQITGGNEVAIANGQSGYVYNTVTGTLAQITDEGFPGAISFDFIDGYITGIEPARRFAFHSNLAAATDYNTLDRYEAEGSPDKLVGQMVDHREWWLFSERTIEPFINTGATTNTFQRASNTMIEVGCASGASIAQMDSSVFWVGNDGIVYRANGYTPVRKSTSALEQALGRCNLAQCFAFTFEDSGHKIYYLTCPDGQTWGYDAATDEWHRRQSEGLSRWRINTLTKWNGVWIAGDYTNGKLYRLNWDVQDEDGAVLERRRITGVLSDNQNRVTVDGVALIFDTGTAISPKFLLPQLSLSGHLPDGAVGKVGTLQYVPSHGVGVVTFAIQSGSLPDGANMDVSGLVTYDYTATGDFNWTVKAVDEVGNIAYLSDMAKVSGQGPQLSGWKYHQIFLSDSTDYSASNFDDSSWPIGKAPFGDNTTKSSGTTPEAPAYDPRFSPLISTHSSLDQRLWIRRTLTLSSVPAGMRLTGFFDNGFVMYFNGVQVASRSAGSAAGITANVSVASLVAGNNCIAVLCDDDGPGPSNPDVCYFDFLLEPL